MSSPLQADALLTRRIRQGDAEAWSELIDRFEGRLLAYVESRTRNRATAEDLVQESFIGFLTSLPNFDGRRPLEGYLFSIAAHKLTDHLRREGRRPTLPLLAAHSDTSDWEPVGSARPASSIARSSERRHLEEAALVNAIAAQIDHCRRHEQWERLKCMELLLVRGWANKEVAAKLGITEQTVANYKFEFLAKLRTAIRSQGLSEDVFPELYQS
jgi:RNA polymerase sigma-70 factor, ECF subfamily